MQRKTLFRFLILSFVLASIIAILSKNPTQADGGATLSLGTTLIGEGEDFWTQTTALPWDMKSEPYPDFFTVAKEFNSETFSVTADGRWRLKALNNDPKLWLHWTGVGTTQEVLKMGDRFPIDANKYKLLSYRMCLDNKPTDPNEGANVLWMYDRTPHDNPANGITRLLRFQAQHRFQNNGDCELLVFDLSQVETINGTWNNTPRKPMGIRLDAINKPKSFQIDWVRLTTKSTSTVVPFQWSGAPSGDDLFFYLSKHGCNDRGMLVGLKYNASTNGTFNWGSSVQIPESASYPLPLPESFEPDSYYVYFLDESGSATCASEMLTIQKAPTLEIKKPSFLSGPDYATEVNNDPWGMLNEEDIDRVVSATSVEFEDGVMTALATESDPRVFPYMDAPINTNKYRYATFRFLMEGPHTSGSGWVQRFVWWYTSPGADAHTTEDMQLYAGWNTYTLDLETAPLENCSNNCWSGQPIVLRFDPFENPKPTLMRLDYLTLTGDEIIDSGDLFPLIYEKNSEYPTTVALYYDTDTNPVNGRTAITIHSPPPPSGANNLFLPSLVGGFSGEPEIDVLNGDRAVWDTNGVPPGTYYISAVISDGLNSTTWYSDIPVIIQ